MSESVFLGIDVGGTFTDLVAYDPLRRHLATRKVPSRPPDFWPSVLEALERLELEEGIEITILHGTTVHLNAFLERKGARTALLTTLGFGDVYEMRRGNRLQPYDMHFQYPPPVVPRSHIYEIEERTRADGSILIKPGEEAVQKVLARLDPDRFEALGICFLHSYRNPANEQFVKSIVATSHPGLFVTASSDFCREWREYERVSTTVINGYVSPVLSNYLARLSEALQKNYQTRIFLLQSNGGLISAGEAQDKGVLTLLSGPVGGNVASRALSRQSGHKNLICIDMGGTSFEASLVVEGDSAIRSEREVGGFPILAPMIDIHTIGAGGGSIAWSDAGALRVGPQSAGADPGPACYDRGGTEATVTDASLFLGRINLESLLSRELGLQHARSVQVLEMLGAELGLSTQAMAEGVLSVINERMANAIRTITVSRGIDPRDFRLVAYGGAGPMHAAEIAALLGISTVIVPRSAGAFSAWGMLHSDLVQDRALSTLQSLQQVDWSRLDRQFGELEDSIGHTLRREGASGSEIHFVRSLDLRYRGQEYAINVALPEDLFSPHPVEKRLDTVRQLFELQYEDTYGHKNPGEGIEISTLRARGIGRSAIDFEDLIETAPAPVDQSGPTVRTGCAIFRGKECETSFVQRGALEQDRIYPGPLVVEESTATTVVPPDFSLSLDALGNLIVERSEVEE